MLKLIDLIKLCGVSLTDHKIHCATSQTHPPLEAYFDGKFRQWQENQNQKNFECSQILSLIHLGGSRWLFVGVFNVLGVKNGYANHPTGFTYQTTEVQGLEQLTGRAIVRFYKKFRASYLLGPKHEDQLFVDAILEQPMTIGEFPGFNSVLLSHAMLRTVVREANPSWKTALGNVAGVYVITDTSSGALYVGSAYGGVGIWQRWSDYAKNGHGGNKELRALLGEKGQDHCGKFHYSILEVCDLNSSDEYLRDREGHWKQVLMTREFGLNRN